MDEMQDALLNDVPMSDSKPPAKPFWGRPRQYKLAPGVSGYKGVRLDKKTGRWQANIYIDGVKRYLGMYNTAEEAAAAYNWAAREVYGEGAVLNDVPMGDQPPVRRTHSRSMQSRPGRDRAVPGYQGVYQDKSSGSWWTQINVSGVKRYLGTYNTAEEAAAAYNRAAKEFFGEAARLNDVP
jgi:AP2-like factor (euAP2 lineage)